MPNPHTITTVKCAQCGCIKQEVNHWFLVWVEPVAMGDGEIFMLAPFSDQFGDDVRPVCGQACAQKELETWMTKVRNSEPPQYTPDYRDLEPYWSDSKTEIERQNSIKGR